MNISSKQLTDTWKQFNLENDHNMQVAILNYGGIITEISVPDRNGTCENVVLGLKNATDYIDNPNFFGALVGRVAGRIKNASFAIENNSYTLDANEGVHHLHGGVSGFDHVVWHAEPFHSEKTVGVKLTHESHDGASGYPGNVFVTVTYTLTNDNELILDYTGTTDKQTPLSLTNHTYFNLSGNLKAPIHHHRVTMDSSHFLEVDKALIPTGQKLPVERTPFDFRHGRTIRDGIESETEQNKLVGNGYDHFFLFDDNMKDKIVITDETSGRVLRIQTNQPGVTMYTANGLTDDIPLKERTSDKHLGVCFETHAPSASLHYEGLPEILLQPDETYQKQTVFTFDVLN